MKTIREVFFLMLIVIISGLCGYASDIKKLSDEEAMVKAMEWQEQHPIYALAPTDWTNGAYYVGVTKAYLATNNPIFLAAIKTMGYRNHWEPCYRKYHADDITISYPYIFVDKTRKGVVNLAPTKEWLDTHLFEPSEWNSESNTNDIKKILWWWCDALFMAPPVVAYYAQHTKEPRYLEAMHRYYMEAYNLLFDKEESLFARDLRYVWTGADSDLKESNGQKVFWSRGNGWVLGGLALMLNDLPKDYEHRNFYETLFKTMAKKIKEIQHKDGLWRTSLLNPEAYNHGEVSGSGFYTFALAFGVNNGLLDANEYKPVVMKAWKALRACQKEDGMVGWVQDIGDSPKPADENSWQNYGTGAFLLAGSEVIKLK